MELLISNIDLILFIFLPLSSLLAYLLVGFWIKYAINHSLLDIPNKRSSHKVGTPTSGGLGIFLTYLLVLIFYFFIGSIDSDYFDALFYGIILVSFIGFLDDL